MTKFHVGDRVEFKFTRVDSSYGLDVEDLSGLNGSQGTVVEATDDDTSFSITGVNWDLGTPARTAGNPDYANSDNRTAWTANLVPVAAASEPADPDLQALRERLLDKAIQAAIAEILKTGIRK